MLPRPLRFVLTRSLRRFYRANKLRSREIPDKRASCLPGNGKNGERPVVPAFPSRISLDAWLSRNG
jgi:hypothetical protein